VLIRPLEGTVGWDWDFTVAGQTPDEAPHNPDANFEVVQPHYFTTLGIPLKAGRAFEPQDNAEHQPVAIVSETLAQRYFGSATNAIGKRLRLGGADSEHPWKQIVGVAGDAHYRALQDARLDLYVPYAQWQPGFVNHFAIRSTLAPAQALALVRREVAALDPTLAVSRVATMDELVAAQLARPRFNAVLLNWLSALALLLAGTGIYGVMAYAVAERTSELGLRIALGAQARDILRLVIGQGMVLVVTGIAIGLLASIALTRLLTNLLFAVSPTDPLVFAGIVALLTFVALVACYIPARRATKVDPLVALRYE
jgi:putative ABC transport system permease protein